MGGPAYFLDGELIPEGYLARIEALVSEVCDIEDQFADWELEAFASRPLIAIEPDQYLVYRSSQGKPKPNPALFHIVEALGHETLCGRDLRRGQWDQVAVADMADALASSDLCANCRARGE